MTPAVELAAEVVLGFRPAGGPYRVTLETDSRYFRTDDQYEIRLKLEERPNVVIDGEECVGDWETIFHGAVTLRQWKAALQEAANWPPRLVPREHDDGR